MKNALLALIPFLVTLGVAEGQVVVADQTYYKLPADVSVGSLGATVAWYQMTNHVTFEDAQILSFHVFDSTSATKPSFVNLRASFGGPLTCGGSLNTEYAGKESGFDYAFNCNPSWGIASRASALLRVQADVVDGQDNSVHRFRMTNASSLQAIGFESNQLLPVFAFAYGVPIRVLRSTLSVYTVANSPTISTISFTTSPYGPSVFNKLTVTFQSASQSTAELPLDNVNLFSESLNNDVVASGYAIKVVVGNTITWFFTAGFDVLPYTTPVSFQLQMPIPLTASIAQATDLVFADGTDPGATTGLNLPAQNFPIKISTAPVK